jgi:MSHA biogenesis protein MshM
MYYEHFGLTRPPFKITPDTSFFYSGGERGSVLDALSYVVLSGEGITKVIGEVGSGKTMLCRMLEERLPENVETVYIANPSISPENILNVIAFEAGLIEQPKSKLEVMQQLQAWLLEKFTQSRRVVVLIEEAQGMPLETLEEIRLLSNLETAQDKLLQLVLFGQPELDENLAQPTIRQLRERITHSFYLNPFERKQAQEYLNFRIRSAGYRGPDLFDAKVSRLIGFYSRGLLRRLNILADKVLLAAYADNTTRLRETHVHKAVVDSHFPGVAGPRWKTWGVAVASLLAGLFIASAIWWWQQQREPLAARASLSSSETTASVFFRQDG